MNWVFVFRLGRHVSAGCELKAETQSDKAWWRTRDVRAPAGICRRPLRLLLVIRKITNDAFYPHLLSQTLHYHEDPDKSKWISDSLPGICPRMNHCMTKEGACSDNLTTHCKKWHLQWVSFSISNSSVLHDALVGPCTMGEVQKADETDSTQLLPRSLIQCTDEFFISVSTFKEKTAAADDTKCCVNPRVVVAGRSCGCKLSWNFKAFPFRPD